MKLSKRIGMNGRRQGGEQLKVLLAFPDSREAALGSPGFREVFRALEEDGGFIIDRAWYDRKNRKIEIEGGKANGSYDIVAFSIPYEPLYFTVVRILLELGIEPEREKRNGWEPFVAVGGAAPTINPSVIVAVADLVYIGEAEEYAAKALLHTTCAATTGAARQLTPMSGMKMPENKSAAPRFISPRDRIDSSFLVGFDDPSLSTFKGAGLVEVGRGCSRGCRFCAAGHIYLPVRYRAVEDILKDVESYRGIADRIGLVGASISDHKHLKDIVRGIIDRGFGLTTSSFRADMLESELAALLKQGGLKTVTIAPEGGSERIRGIVNKHLSEAGILEAVRACEEAGINNIRLYYMVGLPWELDSDIEAIPELTRKAADIFMRPGSRLTVSVNPFIPKPQTPFQWCAMAERRYVEDVYRRLERSFRQMRGVAVTKLSYREAEKEAVLSLGGESVGKAVVENIRDRVPWKKALRNNGVDTGGMIHEEKGKNHVFPWDDVTCEKAKATLYASFEKARRAAEEYDTY